MKSQTLTHDSDGNSCDERSFRLLYESLYHSLLGVANKYVESETARDIVQDTFLRLWNSPESHKIIGDLRLYLYRAVRNGCLNHIRSRKVEDRYRSKGVDIAKEDYFYQALLEEEIFLRMRHAIESLPKIYRDVLSLNLEGLSDMEVSKRLNITLENVKTRKKRGKSMLRGILKEPVFLLFIAML